MDLWERYTAYINTTDRDSRIYLRYQDPELDDFVRFREMRDSERKAVKALTEAMEYDGDNAVDAAKGILTYAKSYKRDDAKEAPDVARTPTTPTSTEQLRKRDG